MPLLAVTRAVSPSLAECELTHLAREAIDVARAAEQHAAYEDVLRRLGARVVHADPAPEHPDAVFIEDTAVVLRELAVLTRPGAPSRRGEVDGVRDVIEDYRPVFALDLPGTLDGGDVVQLGHTLYVGRSSRTNDAGIEALARIVDPFGYAVVPVEFSGCLHLKTAATAAGDRLVLLNPQWVPADAFGNAEVITVHPGEPFAANVVRVGARLVHGAEHPRTRARLEAHGLDVTPVDLGELAKAEGAVTCCSLVFWA